MIFDDCSSSSFSFSPCWFWFQNENHFAGFCWAFCVVQSGLFQTGPPPYHTSRLTLFDDRWDPRFQNPFDFDLVVLSNLFIFVDSNF